MNDATSRDSKHADHIQQTTFLPDRRDPFFVGRESVLQSLQNTLHDHRHVVLSGTEGMGKTSLALEYVYRFTQQYPWIIWLNASTHETLQADIVTVAPQIGLPIDNEFDFIRINEALQAWCTTHQHYLLILDNITDVRLTIAPEQMQGHVLLLTRSQIADQSIAHIELTELDQEDATHVLLRQTAHSSSDNTEEQLDEETHIAITTLAQELNGLPLALKLASAYITTTRCSPQQYLALFRDYTTRLVQLNVSKDRNTDAIAVTCSLPVIHLQQTQPLAVELLWKNIVLAPTYIPRKLLTLTAEEQQSQAVPETLDTLLQTLGSFELLIEHEGSQFFHMQPTVHETLCAAQPPEKQQLIVKHMLHALYSQLPSQEQVSPVARMHIATHVLRLATLSGEWLGSFTECEAGVFSWAASFCWEQKLLVEAEMLLRKTLKIWERTLGTGNPTVGTVQQNLAVLNTLLGNYAEAETLTHFAIRTRSEAFGSKHPDVITSLIQLAQIYRAQNKLREARACYQKAGSLAEQALKPTLQAIAADELAALPAEETSTE